MKLALFLLASALSAQISPPGAVRRFYGEPPAGTCGPGNVGFKAVKALAIPSEPIVCIQSSEGVYEWVADASSGGGSGDITGVTAGTGLTGGGTSGGVTVSIAADLERTAAGRWTLYDSTGPTTLTVRAGAGQSSTNLLSIFANDGTTNRFSVSSAGVGTFASSVSSTGYGHPASAFLINSAAVALGPSVPVTWGPSNYTSADTALSRASANNLAITNGSSTTYWTLGAGGILAGTDNTYDIGASGANRPRNVFIAGYSLTSGVIYAGSSISFGSGASSIINGSGTNGVIVMSNAAGNDFGRLQFGGTTSSFPAWKRSSTTLAARLADDSADAPISASNVTASADFISATTSFHYWGATGSDGSWRMGLDSGNMVIQKRESGSWVSKQVVTP